MPRLKETLDDLDVAGGNPTAFKTEFNKYEVRCGVCDDLFYVDQATYGRVLAAIEFDPTDNPLRCNDCLEEYEEDSISS
jgi:hypothetical protein